MAGDADQRRPVWRVLRAALLSRAAVLSLAFLADALLADYDSSSRYDVPDTSTRCELTDGDEKFPQARPAESSAARLSDLLSPENRAHAGPLQVRAGALSLPSPQQCRS